MFEPHGDRLDELREEIVCLESCLKEGGHPEDMASWRHELHIAQRALHRAEQKQKRTGEKQ